VQCRPIIITQVSPSRECHWSRTVGDVTEYNFACGYDFLMLDNC
jgi:hypothetical protein